MYGFWLEILELTSEWLLSNSVDVSLLVLPLLCANVVGVCRQYTDFYE